MAFLDKDSHEIAAHLLTHPPFGLIRVWKQSNLTHVRCYIDLGKVAPEGWTTGVAIDGSGSMQSQFGMGPFSRNTVRDIGQTICPYIANADKDNGTTLIYWATGDQAELQEHGFLGMNAAQTYGYPAPRTYGKRTNLLPALKYFVDGLNPQTKQPFSNAKFGFFVFVTDGYIDDLEAVKNYSIQLAQAIEAKKRNPLKLILIGVGKEINEQQLIELDSLATGTEEDLYFHRIANDMTDLSEVFVELANENVIIAPNGVVKDGKGKEVANFRDTGVPAKFEFDLPAGATSFTLEVEGQRFTQAIP